MKSTTWYTKRTVLRPDPSTYGYLGIDDDVLWSIVQTDIPTLLANLRLLKTQEPG